ncbi:MAG: prepilin-type N-terminal cleavage/methylation domain-containing protein [Candidatus Omnitrophota bacterium]|nr:MAG: prepilin-type N-terminal cleavage/methylation domain-containing protein [Candidatus Omnitrophota bacterium]
MNRGLSIKTNRGLTFFELLIVVAIIGFITMIAMPNYLESRRKATANTCISNQKLIYTAATMYMLAESDSLVSMGHKERLDALLDRGYLKGNKWPECPSGGIKDYNDYTIIFSGDIVEDVECDRDPTGHVWP